MQEFGQKYVIVQLLEEVPEGTEFAMSEWPLHVTVVGVFATDWSIPDMAERLMTLLIGRRSFATYAKDEAYFGPNQDIRVTLVEKTEELAKLHGDVCALLERGGLRLNDPQFAREGFRPHATVQEHAALQSGETVVFDALTIIDMFPNGDPHRRKVLKTIPFAVV